jgi:hypothetical protein
MKEIIYFKRINLRMSDQMTKYISDINLYNKLRHYYLNFHRTFYYLIYNFPLSLRK